MGRYHDTDLSLTPDGELDIQAGDLVTVTGAAATAQNAYCRLMSADPEWWGAVGLSICANLEDLRGQPNTRDTAEQGKSQIALALTANGLVNQEDLYLDAKPMSRREITFFVFINNKQGAAPIGFAVDMNLQLGAVVRRV